MVDRSTLLVSKESENPDCLGCRLSGGFVFIAIGCYLGSLGKSRRLVSEKYGYFLLASGAVVFGTGYLFNFNPLSEAKK